jgi:DNA-binding LacI/PurR family transcriptional regulator
VARRAGVSITTVSRVLNNHPSVSDEARQKVLAVVNEARYVPTVQRRCVNTVALVYTGDPTLNSPFDAAVLQGMSGALDLYGYDLLVLNLQRARQAQETYSQLFVRKGVRGVIARTTAQTRGVCEEIAAEGYPAVVVGDRIDGISSVYCDSRDASREGIEQLLALGHRRIAMCVNIVDDHDHLDRIAGYTEALTRNGMEYDDTLVFRLPATRSGGIQAVRRIAAMADRPTAIFLADPLTCVGALVEARRMGLTVPGDLSIIGFDDTELRYIVFPQLTSVCQNAEEIGRTAVHVLQAMLNQEEAKPATTVLSTWFEIHDSTGPVEPRNGR